MTLDAHTERFLEAYLDGMETHPEVYGRTVSELEVQYHLLLELRCLLRHGSKTPFRDTRAKHYRTTFGTGTRGLEAHMEPQDFTRAVTVLAELRKIAP